MKKATTNYQYSAEYLKGRLIDFFIQETNNNVYIGNEVMYGIKRKVVDLLIIKNGKLIAVEIKGEHDDLRRLHEQIDEYKKIFDYIFICTTNIHLEKLTDVISKDIGIYLINHTEIKKIRSAKKQSKQNKVDMLYSMNSRFLKNTLKIKRQLDSDEIRKFVAQKSIHKIQKLLCQFFYQRIKEKYQLFLSDRGNVTHIDDIPTLSSNIEIQ